MLSYQDFAHSASKISKILTPAMMPDRESLHLQQLDFLQQCYLL